MFLKMVFYKVITTISILFFILGCGSVKKENPYRPSGKSKSVVRNKKDWRKHKIEFLQKRYNLCTQRRALRSARFEYNKILTREKRYGSNFVKEKSRYKNIIFEINSKRKKEEAKFKKAYKRSIQCTSKEMRYLNI
jgi:hypothetical protein